MSEALKPCPFCRDVAFIRQLMSPDRVHCECLSCGATGPLFHVYKNIEIAEKKAIEAWNTRAKE